MKQLCEYYLGSKKYDWDYFVFQEDLNNPNSPIDGISAFVTNEKGAFYIHTYPKYDTILASLSYNKIISKKI